jgi:hypothetical protein
MCSNSRPLTARSSIVRSRNAAAHSLGTRVGVDVRARWGERSTWTNLIGFVYAFLGSGWFPEVVRDYLAANYRRLACPPEVQPLFLAAFVAGQVLTLDNPTYRRGYRELLHVLSELDDRHIRAHLAVAS